MNGEHPAQAAPVDAIRRDQGDADGRADAARPAHARSPAARRWVAEAVDGWRAGPAPAAPYLPAAD